MSDRCYVYQFNYVLFDNSGLCLFIDLLVINE